MGDRRFDAPLTRIRNAKDPVAAIRELNYQQLAMALAAASRDGDPLLANTLTTAFLNRSYRRAALGFSVGFALAAGIILLLAGAFLLWLEPTNTEDHFFVLTIVISLVIGSGGAFLVYKPARRYFVVRGQI